MRARGVRVHVGARRAARRRPCGTPRSCRRRRRRPRRPAAPTRASASRRPRRSRCRCRRSCAARRPAPSRSRRRVTRRVCPPSAPRRAGAARRAGTRAPRAPRSSVEPTAPVAPRIASARHAQASTGGRRLELERVVQRAHGGRHLVAGDHAADLDRRRRDHAQVDVEVGERAEHAAPRRPGASACRRRSARPCRCVVVLLDLASGRATARRTRSRGACRGDVLVRHRERQLGDAVHDVLDDRVDVDVLGGDRVEHGRGGAGPVGDAGQREDDLALASASRRR